MIGTAATRGDTDGEGTATVGETFPLKGLAFDSFPGLDEGEEGELEPEPIL